MDKFPKRVILPPEEPRTSSLGNVPEDIVIIRDESSMCVIALDNVPLVQDGEVEDSDIVDPDPV